MNESQLIAHVIASGILSELAAIDEYLCEILESLSESPSVWEADKRIGVNRYLVPAKQAERTYRIRLSLMPGDDQLTPAAIAEFSQRRKATQALVDYCAGHPSAGITGVTFNCSQHSYGVFIGVVDEMPETICVIVGPSIPPFAMRS